MTLMERCLATLMISAIGAGCPYKWTGIAALVLGVIAALRPSGVMLKWAGSTSTEDRRGPDGNDGLGGGDECVRGSDYFIAGADAKSFERQGEGIGPVADADREPGSAGGPQTSARNRRPPGPLMN